MFGILLLLAAAFSGHEVARAVDAKATQPTAAQTVVHTAAEQTQVPSSRPVQMAFVDDAARPDAADVEPVPMAAEPKDRRPQDTPASRPVPVADEMARPDQADVDAAVDQISDFYDTAPATAPPHKHPPMDAGREPVASRPILGPHLVGSTEKYVSEGRPVVIEVLRPDNDDRRPAVLILHGASGIGDGAFYRGAAEIFAEHGYVTFLPHYLAAIRSVPVKSKTLKGRAAAAKIDAKRPRPGTIRAEFPEQEQVLRDALNYMAQSPYVDSTHIGVFGLSLGGFHALTLSSHDDRIVAVVDMSGALRGNAIPASNHLAPTLELHGGHDPIIPVARAKALAATLSRLGVPHELKIYPNQGHFLRGKAQQDALQRAAEFFGTYLTPSETSHAARSGDGVD
jgi:carboxymethylenebutenolidase